MIPSYIKDSKIAIIVFDLSSKASFNDLDFWLDSIKTEGSDNLMLGIIGNKLDIENKEVTDEEIKEKLEKYKDLNILYAKASAKSGEGLSQFIENIISSYAETIKEEDDKHNVLNDNPEEKKIELNNNQTENKKKKTCC